MWSWVKLVKLPSLINYYTTLANSIACFKFRLNLFCSNCLQLLDHRASAFVLMTLRRCMNRFYTVLNFTYASYLRMACTRHCYCRGIFGRVPRKKTVRLIINKTLVYTVFNCTVSYHTVIYSKLVCYLVIHSD